MPVGNYQHAPTTPPKKRVRKLEYPTFWVEAFNSAYQRWVSVDALVTDTVNKSGKLEPPASYEPNQMLYVLAFEEDSVAKDVTRRYVKAYNAKTRKNRVEVYPGGDKWWRKATKAFRRSHTLVRNPLLFGNETSLSNTGP